MTFSVRGVDLAKLNSLTKYPSIPTYHTLDPKNGGLIEETISFSGNVIGTEKIDGTNARIIFLPDGNYIIGSREELLYAKGDLIGNPALGIVDSLKSVAENIELNRENSITVFFGEVYGGKVSAASKNYTSDFHVSFRLFDIAKLEDYENILEKTAHEIAIWRDNGGQNFLPEKNLQAYSSEYNLSLTPRLFQMDAEQLPKTIEESQIFLKNHLSESKSKLDDSAIGKPEGIVLRSIDRSAIAKARFDDYERTIKRRSR